MASIEDTVTRIHAVGDLLNPLLGIIGFSGGARVEEIAYQMRVESEDEEALHVALALLEECGLVEPTGYRLTDSGKRALH